MIRLRIENPCPPIPVRDCDYACWDDRYSPDDHVVIGWGKTPERAIADWINKNGANARRIELQGDRAALVEMMETTDAA